MSDLLRSPMIVLYMLMDDEGGCCPPLSGFWLSYLCTPSMVVSSGNKMNNIQTHWDIPLEGDADDTSSPCSLDLQLVSISNMAYVDCARNRL